MSTTTQKQRFPIHEGHRREFLEVVFRTNPGRWMTYAEILEEPGGRWIEWFPGRLTLRQLVREKLIEVEYPTDKNEPARFRAMPHLFQ